MRKAIDNIEVILEFVQAGALVRGSALESTLTEVVTDGSADAGSETLFRLVRRKLDYVLGRRPPRGDNQTCLSKTEPCSRACRSH